MALDATVGGANANSYGTVAEADAYFLNRPDSDAWDEADDQEQALIWATLLLDQLDYIGDVATTTQALKWPRIDSDVFTDIGWDDDEIPPKLKYAQFEIALSALEDLEAGTSASDQPVKSLKIGSSVQVQYDTTTTTSTRDAVGIPIQASRLLRGLRLMAVIA